MDDTHRRYGEPGNRERQEGDDATVGLPQRLEFLGLGPGDSERLRELLPTFRTYADEFVEAFYAHLFRFPETAKFLQNPDLVARLKQAQKEHFESMLASRWDAEYVAHRRRVGDAHAEVGIDPDMFLGAYNQYVQHCFPHFVAGLGEDAERALTMLLPLVKAIFLDIGLTLDAYFHQATRSLRFALDMVWKANNELRQFAQLTSHDLKTPLATVANLCDEALDEFGDAMPREARQLIEAARNRTFRMSATIDELLESSLSAARGDGEDEVMGDEFVDDAIERVRPVLEKKQIEVAVARPLPTVWGNKIRLREAFYNLVANAAKFIDRTAGRIDISAEIRDEECVFCVADNGPGIHADELERVFTPFRRMKAHRGEVRTELGSGSGLGLYFTKSIVEQYGGRIWVESRVGDGSRFYVALPRTGSRTDAARADAASRGRRDFTG